MERVVGIFQRHAHFGFIIPEDRDVYGGDFFVTEKNFRDAKDGDKVVGHIMVKAKGKKPEAKIVQVGAWGEKKATPKNIVGIYSEHGGEFGFVDIPGEEKGVFVFKKDNNGAKDGDKVEARIKIFKGRKEAVVIKILKNDAPIITGVFKDQGKFGFVVAERGAYTSDIFVAGAKKMNAKDGDSVEVQVIKEGGRRPEGVIRKII